MVEPEEASSVSSPLEPANSQRQAGLDSRLSPASNDIVDTVVDFSHEKSKHDVKQSPDTVRRRPSRRNAYTPNYFLFTRYIDQETGLLYAMGTTAAVLAGLAFPSLDLLYGNFTSANASSAGGQFTAAEAAEAQSTARTVGLGILGVGIGELIFTWIFLVCFTRAGEKMGRKIRNAYLESVLRQDIAFFDNVGAGEVAGRTTKDIATIQAGIGEKLAFAIWCFTTIVVGIIIGFIKAARMAGVLLSLIPFTLALYWVTVHYGNKYTAEEMEAEGKAGSFLDQVLGSIRIVQAFAAEKSLSDRYDQYLKKIEIAGFKKAVVRGSELSVLYYCVITSFAFSFWWGSQLLHADGTGIGLGPLTTTFFVFLSGLFSIAGIVPQITTITESAQVQARIFSDIDRVPEIDSSSNDGFQGAIDSDVRLDHVTFAHPSRPTLKSLDDVSLHFEANKTTAIVGSSGSGKSTVTSLLLRFYDPHSGSVTLGSQEVKDFNVSHLRRNVAMCSQNPTMFNMTVFENIAAGMTGVSHLQDLSADEKYDAVVQAARDADALQFIEALPKGFNTVVGTAGAFLSGGQRQRVAIARALIRDPKVLILDEATSALDSSSEKRVYEALDTKRGERTLIIIAHRISSIKNSDKIIVMGHGRVLEEGTHNELINAAGPYKELVDKTNANNYIPGVNDIEDEDKLPSEKTTHRPANVARSTTYDSKSALSGTHDSYVTRSWNTDQAQLQEKSRHPRQLLKVPTNIEANPEGLVRPMMQEQKKKYSGPVLLRRFGNFAREQWMYFALGVFGSACVGATFPTSAYLTGRVIEALSELAGGDAASRSRVHTYAFWYEILAVIVIFTGFASGFFLCFASEKLVRRFRDILCRALVKQEVGFFDDDDNSIGALTSGISSHPAAVAAASGLVLSQLLISSFNLIGSVALAYAMNWKLAVVCLAPAILFVIFAYANVVLLERYENEGQDAHDESASYASDNIGAIREVQAMTREEAVHDHYANLLHPDNDKNRLKYLYLGVLGFAASQACIFWVSGLTFWWGSRLLTRNEIGELAFYSTFEAVIIASSSTGRASSFIPDISRAFHSMKVIVRYLDRIPRHQTILTTCASAGGQEKATEGSEIVFKGVSLRYPSRPDAKVLQDLNLRIQAGQHIAFCGHSGGGKTSTLSLLQRYYDPVEGSISFDGQDIRKIALDDHRARMSLVSQDAILYEGTVAWNLSLGGINPHEVSLEDMHTACKAANILDFVESLPHGFETQIGIKGGQLSGGQKQRLCIARALIRNPRILLLDEATSALDATAERSVQEALERASKGRTTITIAHRLSTIANADMIYVVQDGRIVEGGNHKELLQMGGKYKELIEAQLA